MRVLKNVGLVMGGLTFCTWVHAQAPAVQRARENAAASENASEGRARAADAADDDYGGGGGGGQDDADDTTRAADRAAADDGGGGGGGGGAEGGGGEPAPEEYTVVPGDTLWDLCERFLQNPFYWPKIWSINPHIENAHWIYPGNIIRFYAAGEGGGGGGGEDGEGGEGGQRAPGQEDLADGEGGDEFSSPSQLGEDGSEDEGFDSPSTLDEPIRPEQLFDGGNMAKLQQQVNRRTGYSQRLTRFVSKKEMEKAGEVAQGLAGSLFLTRYQDVVLSVKSTPQVGDTYQVFHTTREVTHPSKPGGMGHLVEVLGMVRVTKVENGKAIGQITEAYAPIERGDKVAPFTDWGEAVEIKPNTKTVKAVVADTYEEYATTLGEYHLAFIDKGRGDGVEAGNTFDVIRNEDAVTGESFKGPDEIVGRIIILDARDGVSTGLITMSHSEIMVGDRAEMRPPKQAAE